MLITLFGGEYHRKQIESPEKEFIRMASTVSMRESFNNNFLQPVAKETTYVKHFFDNYLKFADDGFFYLAEGLDPAEFLKNIILDYLRL